MNLEIEKKSKEFSFRDFAILIWEGKFVFIIAFVLSILIALIVAFTSPAVYQCTSILVSRTSGGSKSVQLAGLAAMAGIQIPKHDIVDPGIYLSTITNDIGFLRKITATRWFYLGDSLTMEEIICGKHVGSAAIGQSMQLVVINQLRNRMIRVANDKNTNFLTLSTFAPSPSLSLQLNERVLLLLDEHMKSNLRSQAREKRIFIEQRLDEIESGLKIAENELSRFREKNSSISAPKLQVAQERLIRDVEINGEIFKQLRMQYEFARIDEKNDQPVIEVVLHPEEPLFRFSPQRKKILGIGLFVGFLMSFLILFCLRWLQANFGLSFIGHDRQK